VPVACLTPLASHPGRATRVRQASGGRLRCRQVCWLDRPFRPAGHLRWVTAEQEVPLAVLIEMTGGRPPRLASGGWALRWAISSDGVTFARPSHTS